MKILIAGSTGLVGSALVRKFNSSPKELEIIELNSKIVDFRDRKKTFDFLTSVKPTIVIDAAAKVGGIGANSNFPVDFLADNLQIQCNLIDASHSIGVEKFVF